MMKSQPRDSCRPLFTQLEILPLPCVYIYECVNFVKRDLLQGRDIFSQNSNVHSHNTRSHTNVHRKSVSTALHQKATLHSCSIIYNSLPDHIKNINTLHRFKNEVKDFLLHHCFYSVRDFMSTQNV